MKAGQPPLSIATLICMLAGSPLDLALKAIRSTAASLTSSDSILLFIDGGLPEQLELFQQAAAPVPLRLLGSPNHQGLAACLNELIDKVLDDQRWDLIARMDADDESLPGRMESQRQFLLDHPEIDILGTACHEIDEHANYLQLKKVPLCHRQILMTLPRSNPMNHPTVMMRRRVFESGLRYREDVKLTEDYHLWISAAKAGFKFANLDDPLLNFLRDSTFFRRRGGWRQACANLQVRLRAMAELRLFSLMNLLWAFAAFGLRVLPATVQTRLYIRLR